LLKFKKTKTDSQEDLTFRKNRKVGLYFFWGRKVGL